MKKTSSFIELLRYFHFCAAHLLGCKLRCSNGKCLEFQIKLVPACFKQGSSFFLSKRESFFRIKGFTLIELLISLFIFAIIAVITTMVLHSVFTTRDSINKRSYELNQLQLADIFIRKDFSQIINRPVRDENGNLLPAIIPAATSVEFTRTGIPDPSGLLQRSSLQRIRYEFRGDELIRTIWPRLDRIKTNSSNNQPQEQVLIKNIHSGSFSYLGSDKIFYDNWPPGNLQQPPLFPLAIKISFSVQGWGKGDVLIPMQR